MTTAALLVIAVGNPSRGDDALGPMLLERLRGDGVECGGDVELLIDFQLQVEHSLDLDARSAVLFVDAAWPGAAIGVTLSPIAADEQPVPASHALRPEAVLHVAAQINGYVPPAWLLAIEGESFTLGDGLSAKAARHLEVAVTRAHDWLQQRRSVLSVLEPQDA